MSGRVTALGAVKAPAGEVIAPSAIDWEAVEDSRTGCEDVATTAAMCAAIDEARVAGESLGGIFEIWCWGVCPGLGGYATYADRLDGRLVGALASIPAVKGVEIGDAFVNSALPGSEVHDAIYVRNDSRGRWVARQTNRAGGLEGGMTNGMPLVLRAAMKPIPTLTTPLPAADLDSLEPTSAHVERSDVAAVPAARVVGEAMVAIVMAQAYREKFGGDSIEQMRTAVLAYEHEIEARGLWRRS